MPVRSPAGTVLNGIFYVTGGGITYPQPATQLNTVFAYNPVTDTWSTRAPMPTARTQHGVAAIGGILYAVGGNSPAGVFSTLEAYNPATDTWTTKTPMPTARYLISVAVLDGLLYVVGGVDAPGNYLATVEAYDPATDSWATLPSMPTARQQPALGALGGKIYAAGGYNPTSGSLSVLEAFTPSPSFSAGVQPPINSDGTSVFSVKRGVVPVKFTLTENGSATCALPPASIAVWRTAGTSTGAVNESVYIMAADTGSNFRIDNCQYVYNLNVNALEVGSYLVAIEIGTEVVGSASFKIK